MRVTKCLTWGEERRTGAPLVDAAGVRFGFIDFVEWVTLCGRNDDDPKYAASLSTQRLVRPKGVCPQCWKSFRSTMLELPDNLA